MIPINSQVPAGSERGVAALLDLITNPKRALEVKATLDELVRTRDEADAALAQANAQHAENMKRSKELDQRESKLSNEREAFDAASRALASAEAKHSRETSQALTEIETARAEISARAVAVASAEQSIARERGELAAREAALGPKELAAASLKAEYDRKLAELKKLTGQL